MSMLLSYTRTNVVRLSLDYLVDYLIIFGDRHTRKCSFLIGSLRRDGQEHNQGLNLVGAGAEKERDFLLSLRTTRWESPLSSSFCAPYSLITELPPYLWKGIVQSGFTPLPSPQVLQLSSSPVFTSQEKVRYTPVLKCSDINAL